MASSNDGDDDVCIVDERPQPKRARAASPDLVVNDSCSGGDNDGTCPLFRLLRTKARTVRRQPFSTSP